MRKRQHSFQTEGGDDQENVAITAADILAGAEAVLADIESRTRVADEAHPGSESSPALPLSADGAARLPREVDAQLRADGASIAAIRADLARMHGQLDQITAGVVALQTHSLRQTGAVALTLSVVIAIGWKVIAG